MCIRDRLGMSNDEMSAVFAEWNKGELDSYLIEITRDILAYRDENGEAVVDKILDTAGQKGTGKWTGIAALDEGVPLTLSLGYEGGARSRCIRARLRAHSAQAHR